MKRTWMILIVLAMLLAAFALPGSALAAPLIADEVVLGDNFTLAEGETLEGSLLVFGGNALLQDGSTVTRDVVVFGGNVSASGSIGGSVVVLGGNINLTSTARVGEDVVSLGGSLSQATGAQVQGEVMRGFRGPFLFNLPGGVNLPQMDLRFDPFFGGIWFMLRAFLWAGAAVLLALFLPLHTRRIAQTATSQAPISGGLGLLTVVVAPVALVILTVTIIMIPVALLAALVIVIAWVLGITALGMEVGERLERAAHQQWAPVVSAGLGTFLLVLVLNGARLVIPCVGWLLPALAGMLGLGAVILTRFGTQVYPPFATSGMAPAVPPIPPVPAVPTVPAIPAEPTEPPARHIAAEPPASPPEPGVQPPV